MGGDYNGHIAHVTEEQCVEYCFNHSPCMGITFVSPTGAQHSSYAGDCYLKTGGWNVAAVTANVISVDVGCIRNIGMFSC